MSNVDNNKLNNRLKVVDTKQSKAEKQSLLNGVFKKYKSFLEFQILNLHKNSSKHSTFKLSHLIAEGANHLARKDYEGDLNLQGSLGLALKTTELQAMRKLEGKMTIKEDIDIKYLDFRVHDLLKNNSQKYQDYLGAEELELYWGEITNETGDICLAKGGKYHTFDLKLAGFSKERDSFARTKDKMVGYPNGFRPIRPNSEAIHLSS